MTDKIALELLSKSRILKYTLFKNPELLDYMQNRYTDIPENELWYKEAYWRLKYNIETRPVCPICGKPVEFIGSEYSDKIGKTKLGYRKTCSKECAYQNEERSANISQAYYSHTDEEKETIKVKRAKTNIERFGYENAFKSPEIHERIVKTQTELYGGYGLAAPVIKQKCKDTVQKRYGVDNVFQSEIIKERIKETCMNRYGVNYYTQTEESRKHSQELFSSAEYQEKLRQSMNEKYGVDNVMQVKEFADKAKETMIQNGTFRTSKQEQLLLELIKEIYPDVIWQYNNDGRYPFMCDFYIPSKDLFIEYNGANFHGYHRYNPKNKADVEKVAQLNDKGFCTDTWAKNDPEKLKIATENKLNYLVLYLSWFEKWDTYTHTLYHVRYKTDCINKIKDLIENTTGINIVGETY